MKTVAWEKPYRFSNERALGRDALPIRGLHSWHQRPMAPHYHEFLEIVLVLEGSARQVTVGQRREIRPGTLLVVPPGVWHAYEHCQGLHIDQCLIGREFLARELHWVFAEPGLAYLLSGKDGSSLPGVLLEQLEEREFATLTAQFARLDNLDSRDTPANRLTACAVLLEVLRDVREVVYEKTHQHAANTPAATRHVCVQRAVTILNETYAEDLSTKDLAQRIGGIHPGHLMRLFRAQVGMTIVNYLTQQRAHHAANLMLASDHSLTEIGARVGWGDPAYFSRRFRSVFGVNPRAYRQKLKAGGEAGSH